MASLLLAAPNARAGSYTHTQTGGTTPSIVTPAADATHSDPEFAGAEASAASRDRTDPATYTIQVSPGTLTDTFTWTHGSGETDANDPPPASVLVEQASTSLWYVKNENGTGTGSGTNDCGLPGAAITSSTYSGEQVDDPSADRNAILYSVQPSGASFSVSCRPTTTFTGTTGTDGLWKAMRMRAVGPASPLSPLASAHTAR
jgi:hypothetical protein